MPSRPSRVDQRPSRVRLKAEDGPHLTAMPSAVQEALAAAVVAVDLQGLTTFWSRHAEVVFGWTSVEALGRIPPNVPFPLQQEWQLEMRLALDAHAPTRGAETQCVTRDGRIVWVVRTTAPLREMDGSPAGVVYTLTDVTGLKQLEDEARALAQVRERELIAMDLHDGLLQDLYGVTLALDNARRSIDPPHPQAEAAIAAARARVDELGKEARHYLFDARDTQLVPPDLGAALRVLADGVRLSTGLAVGVQFDSRVEPLLEAEVRGNLVYLAREAISNVVKHAHARSLCIEVSRTAELVHLSVVDDGRGFNVPRSAPGSGHHGLRNMRERAHLVGGKLEVSSRLGAGTRVSVEVPIFQPGPPF